MRWFDGNIVDAVKLSKSKNAYFVVYIEGSDDKSKSITKMLNEANISSRLTQETFVCIKLESSTDSYKQFAEIYKLVPVPSIFFIGDNGVPVEIVTSDKAVSGSLMTIIDNLIAKKGISGAALSNPSSTSTNVQSNSAATSSFIAAEQASTTKVAEKKSQIVTPPPAKVEAKPSADKDIEYETVCEGDVCVRRPKSKSSPESDSGVATLSTSPSTSDEAMDIETEPKEEASPTLTIEEKVQHAKELLEKKRLEKMEKEKEEEKRKEIERRSQGQGVAELKRWQQEQEFKNLKEERMKEKKENEMQRAKILQQIAQDRADRQKQFAPIPATTSKPESSTKSTSPKPETSNITKIQFKMADGSSHTTQVGSDSTLSELRDYVRKNIQTSGSFTLSTMYPRQILGEDKDSETLRTLELCPSSVLLLLKGALSSSSTSGPSSTVSDSGGFFGMLSHIFWSFIVSPAQGFWFWISSFITGNTRPRGPRTPTDNSENARNARKFPSNEENAKRRRVANKGGSGTTSIQKEGNTYRLKDNDSDDENNTWNGNSTQQM